MNRQNSRGYFQRLFGYPLQQRGRHAQCLDVQQVKCFLRGEGDFVKAIRSSPKKLQYRSSLDFATLSVAGPYIEEPGTKQTFMPNPDLPET